MPLLLGIFPRQSPSRANDKKRKNIYAGSSTYLVAPAIVAEKAGDQQCKKQDQRLRVVSASYFDPTKLTASLGVILAEVL
jgi:hypothetical protein